MLGLLVVVVVNEDLGFILVDKVQDLVVGVGFVVEVFRFSDEEMVS